MTGAKTVLASTDAGEDPVGLAASALETQADVLQAQVNALRAQATVLRSFVGRQTTSTDSTEKLVTKQALAELIGYTPQSIDRLCREKKIPWFEVGEVRRFRVSEVIKALPSHAVETKVPAPAPSEPGELSGVRCLSRKGRAA